MTDTADAAATDAPDDLVLLERLDGNIAVIRLNNGKLNALSQALLRRLHEIVLELKADLPGAVIVTGNERSFAAGAEISEFGGPEEARVIGETFTITLSALAALSRVTIAAVNGFALGGGCELALACDFRIASTSARFGQPEILLGIIPGGGGTQRLARLIGPAKAKDLIFTGRQVKADEALAIGLVDEVVEGEHLFDRAVERAAELARGAVVAQALAKHAIDHGLERPLEEGLILEQGMFVEVFKTEDAVIGVQSFLANGPGKATFTGR
jgi:enoyl-CoA hydratase/carnithine racemase